MKNQSSKKKLQLSKEKLRNLTPKELTAVGGGNGAMDGIREASAVECETPVATDTCLV